MKPVINLAYGLASGSLRAWFVILLLASHSASALDVNWGTVTDLSSIEQDFSRAQIALSSDGTMATAVWARNNGLNNIIQSRSATISGNTTAWGAITDLSALGQDSFTPQIALSSDGTMATAIWFRNDGSNIIIQSRSAMISENLAIWGAGTDLSALGQDSFTPQIALSSDGTKATAVWTRNDGLNNIIQSRPATISGNTTARGAVTDLSAIGRDARIPQIALSSDGTMATAIWFRNDGSNNIIQSRSATITSGCSFFVIKTSAGKGASFCL